MQHSSVHPRCCVVARSDCTSAAGGARAPTPPARCLSLPQVLTAGVIVWSVFTCLTPTAASLGLTLVPLMICRAAMGMGEGVAFPAISSLFSE